MEAIEIVRKLGSANEMTVGQFMDALMELQSIMSDKSKFSVELLTEMDSSSQFDMFSTYINKSIHELGKQLIQLASIEDA